MGIVEGVVVGLVFWLVMSETSPIEIIDAWKGRYRRSGNDYMYIAVVLRDSPDGRIKAGEHVKVMRYVNNSDIYVVIRKMDGTESYPWDESYFEELE